VELTHGAIDAFNRRDLGAYLALQDPEVEFLPYEVYLEGGDPYRGHAGIRQWWEDVFAVFPDIRAEVYEIRVFGYRTLVHGCLGGQGAGSGAPMERTMWLVNEWRAPLFSRLGGPLTRDNKSTLLQPRESRRQFRDATSARAVAVALRPERPRDQRGLWLPLTPGKRSPPPCLWRIPGGGPGSGPGPALPSTRDFCNRHHRRSEAQRGAIGAAGQPSQASGETLANRPRRKSRSAGWDASSSAIL
jgi:hypothetical protein